MTATVRQIAAYVLGLAADRCTTLSRALFMPPPPPPPPVPLSEKRVISWHEVNGDRTLRLNYDLSENDVVLDVGGYEGQWASDIFAMYGCRIHIFEPVPEFADAIRKRFARNPKLSIHNFGLSSSDQIIKLHLAGASSSRYRADGPLINAKLVDVAGFLERSGIREIHLMKINIEGGEYDLLERIISTGTVSNIRNIQIQFHDFVPDALKRVSGIRDVLALTHRPTYQYDFVWESWQAKTWPPNP